MEKESVTIACLKELLKAIEDYLYEYDSLGEDRRQSLPSKVEKVLSKSTTVCIQNNCIVYSIHPLAKFVIVLLMTDVFEMFKYFN